MTGSVVVPAPAGAGCPGLEALNPICQIGGAVSSLAGSGVSAVFGALSGWVVTGAAWLLGQLGGVLSATTAVHVGATWFVTSYREMALIAAVVMLPLVLGSVIQAVYRQSAGPLLRTTLVHLPLALLLTGVAVALVRLALAATDALCRAVAAGSGDGVQRALGQVTGALTAATGDPAMPAFVLLLGGLLVAAGAFVIWLELLVRAASVYVAVLFLPLALAGLVWPATAHWCRRLVETLVALIVSKFVIVAILSLAVGAIVSGTASGSGTAGFAAVLSGGALLLLAAHSPFTLLKLVPMVESGAVHHLEGARHRLSAAATAVPRSAASLALRQAGGGGFDPGLPGTGRSQGYGAPGASGAVAVGLGRAGAGGPGGGWSGGDGPGDVGPDGASGIPMWQGDPEGDRAVWALLAGAGPPGAPEGGAGGEGPSFPRGSGAPGAAGVVGSSATPGSSGDGVGVARPPGPASPPRAPLVRPWRDGVHVIDRDDVGPVIRWIPPSAPPDGGANEGGDGD